MPDQEFDDMMRRAGDLDLDERDVAAAHQRIQARLQRVIADEQRPTGQRLRRRSARRPTFLVLAVLALGGGGAVAQAVLTSEPKISAGIACYGNAQRTGAMIAAPVDGRPAVETCADIWRAGVFGADRTAPALQACVDPAGDKAIQVLPGATALACTQLELKPAPDAARSSGAYAKATRALYAAEKQACLSSARARELALAEIRSKSLKGWTVKSVGATSANEPCAAFGFDSGLREIAVGATTDLRK